MSSNYHHQLIMKTILVVEDEKAIRQNIVKILSHSGFQALHAADGAEGIEMAKAYNPDLIICDIMMPGWDGFEVLRSLRENQSTNSIPFIFLSAKVDKPDIRQGMNLGADDYLTKPFTSAELIETVQARFNRQDTLAHPYEEEMKRAAENLNHLAFYDSVTDLPNLILLHQRLQEQTTQAKATSDASIAVLRIHCSYSNGAKPLPKVPLSELLLRAIAERLKKFTQGLDEHPSPVKSWIARLGEHEFALILSRVLVSEDVVVTLKALIAALQAPYEIERQREYLRVQIGAALYPNDGETASEVLGHADVAAQYCLTNHEQDYCFYLPEMEEEYAERQKMLQDLQSALEHDEFYLVYQPQVNLVTERIVGVEALLRWRHPELGDILPEQFIPLAKEAQILPTLGTWVIEQASQQMIAWRSLTLIPLQLSINLWPQQLQDSHFFEYILQSLQKANLNPDQLVFDISEACLMALQFKEVDHIFRELANIGIQIAIDGFGMHSMPLQHLKRLPIHILKLDKSFIDHIVDDERDAIITEAIIAMAQSLKLKVLAKGIETEEQLTVLTKHGCHVMQGYLYSPPLSPEELEQLLTVGKVSAVG